MAQWQCSVGRFTSGDLPALAQCTRAPGLGLGVDCNVKTLFGVLSLLFSLFLSPFLCLYLALGINKLSEKVGRDMESKNEFILVQKLI